MPEPIHSNTDPTHPRQPSAAPDSFRPHPLRTHHDLPRFAPPVILILLGLILLAHTWGTWTDLTVDFGREAYLAWRIADGDSLYQHIASFAGPVSPTFNALLVTTYANLTGSSTSSSTLPALVVGNILVFLILITIAYRLLRLFTHRVPATLACSCAIACCMGLQTTGVGNFNFITPYAHELTHGLTAALLTLLLLSRSLITPRRRTPRLILAGALIGLSIHLKPEIAVALVPTVFIFLILHAILHRHHPTRFSAQHLLTLLAPALLVALAIPLVYGFEHVFKGWSHLRDETIRAMPFYQRVTGLDATQENLLFAIGRSAWVVALVLLIRFMTRPVPAHSTTTPAKTSHHPIPRLATAIAIAVALAWLTSRLVEPAPSGLVYIWLESTRSWIIILPLMVLLAFIALIRPHTHTTVSPSTSIDRMRVQSFTLFMLSTFATLCLAKIALHASLQHYGFALAFPSLLIVAAIFASPRSIDVSPSRIASPHIHSTSRLGMSVVIAFAIAHVWIAGFWQHRKTLPLASLGLLKIDPDRSLSIDFINIMNHLRTHARPGDGLAVLPEGALLNLLTDQPNPSGYIVTMPVEAHMFGEANILSALQNRPPRWIALRQTSLKAEYGVEGLSYMPNVVAWINANYQPTHSADPTDDQSPNPPAMLLLERISTTTLPQSPRTIARFTN